MTLILWKAKIILRMQKVKVMKVSKLFLQILVTQETKNDNFFNQIVTNFLLEAKFYNSFKVNKENIAPRGHSASPNLSKSCGVEQFMELKA